MSLKEKLSKTPWKELMIGEGLLSVGLGFVLLILAFNSTDSLYNLLHYLDKIQLKNLLLLSAEAVLSVGFLLIGLPILVSSAMNLLGSKFIQDSKE